MEHKNGYEYNLIELESNYQSDLEKGKYETYLAKYPNRFEEICTDLIKLLPVLDKDEKLVKSLISNGFNLNQRNKYTNDVSNIEPLVSFCQYRKYESIYLFIRLGASLDTCKNLINTLIIGDSYADIDGELVEMVKFLIKRGARIEYNSRVKDLLMSMDDFAVQLKELLGIY